MSMRIYVDTPPVIYSVQQVVPFAQKVSQRLAASGVLIVTSELVRMECLVLPLRNGDNQLVADFDTWFALQVNELVQFSSTVFRRAAKIRAQLNFRTPDSLHLAAAVESGCDLFLTNDTRLMKFSDLRVEVL